MRARVETLDVFGWTKCLVVRDSEENPGHFLHSKEGVNQGDSLAMITYGIGVLPLIRDLWDAHPRVTQLWYADDLGAGGTFERILSHLWDLQARGVPRGSFLEPTKNILVVAPRNVARADEFFREMGMTLVTGTRYLGGLIGDREAKDKWLSEKMQGWAESAKIISGVACKHPKSA